MKARWLMGALALVLAASGCSGDDSDVVSGDDDAVETAPTSIPATTTTAAPTVVRRDAGVQLPRGFTYGNVEFELTKVEFATATPGSYLDDEPEPGDDELLFVSFTAAFEPDFPGVADQWAVDDFKLVTGAGRTIAASGVDFASGVSVSGSTETATAVVFPADDEDLEGAVFRLDDGTHLPAEVPLEGSVPPDPYPVAVAVTGEGAVTYEGGCADATGTVRLLGGEWDVDGGVDATGKAILGSGTTRTLANERFLWLRVQAIAAAGTCGGTLVSGDHFRLVVDGLPLNNENVSRTELLADGEGVELVWGYRVPVSAQQLELEVGTVGGTTVRFPIPPPTGLA
ncbi:MAG TPA: hypothetical protein VF183_02490 [Acidimicrobiales bacterium]